MIDVVGTKRVVHVRHLDHRKHKVGVSARSLSLLGWREEGEGLGLARRTDDQIGIVVGVRMPVPVQCTAEVAGCHGAFEREVRVLGCTIEIVGTPPNC